MGTRQSDDITVQQKAELLRIRKICDQMARRVCVRDRWAADHVSDISNHAQRQLQRWAKKMEILNVEAFLNTVMRNRLLDLGRKRKSDQARLVFMEDELDPRGEFVPHGQSFFDGLSNQHIAKENARIVSLKASASIAIMPTEYDRELLKERFYDLDASISDLARRRNKTPNAMANYLQKILGGNGQVGALEPVYQVIDGLPLTTAEAFVKILQHFEEQDVLSDPIAGAISHLQYASKNSKDHRRLAVFGIARLTWLGKRKISNRGLTNKLLQRLVKAACFYVHEVNDAKHDTFDARGLSDDIKVLEVVFEVVQEFQIK